MRKPARVGDNNIALNREKTIALRADNLVLFETGEVRRNRPYPQQFPSRNLLHVQPKTIKSDEYKNNELFQWTRVGRR